MTAKSNKVTSNFTGKPKTNSYYTSITAFTTALGPVDIEHKAQASFSVKRKFLWLWTYEKTADGTLYLNVTLDRSVDDPYFHNVTQVSTNRWNHHVEVKSEAIVTSDWLHALIREGYEFARR